MKQSVKLLQKAKESRMYMPHAKTQEVQQNNHTIIRVDTYKYAQTENAKTQQRKNLIILIWQFQDN